MRRQYGGWSLPPEPGESVTDYLSRLESDIEAKLKNLIIGDATEVAERLREFASLGFDLIVCRSQFGNLPRDLFHDAVEGLGRVRAEVAS
jgi:alkanesulfonate monooxygenase SsuD/methylene tetrahydromethanopterin reductase-like flavin-dependent oxidoreductase (luciferase family)